MKFPSLNSLVSSAVSTFRRFAAAIVAAVTVSVFSMLLLHLSYEQTDSLHWYWNIVISAYLGMLLLVALAVFAERKNLGYSSKILLQLAGIAVSVAYYSSLPDHFTVISNLRTILFALGLHWLIAFIPFTNSGELNGFWQYNKTLFLRILTSALYTAVLYIGLSLALLAIENLFGINIDGKRYGDLWIFLTGIFNTWFFLAGFPANYTALNERTDYPKGLKIFTQYVLLPILVVYIVILYVYTFKIIFTAHWPVGWVSYLVLGFSVAGILSLLLIYPVRTEESNKWILSFSKFFYFALFPLLILLFCAIARRIKDYGLTELRYFVLLLALWLLLIAVYFLVSVTKNIKLIPMSLCLIAFLSAYGPWGAFSISLKSQEKQLVSLLKKDKLLANEKVIRATSPLSFTDRKQISSITEYLVDMYGYRALQPLFAQNLDSLMKRDGINKSGDSYDQTKEILSQMNITYLSKFETEDPENGFFEFYTDQSDNVLNIEGYDYLISGFQVYTQDMAGESCSTYQAGSKTLNICFDPSKSSIAILNNKDSLLVDMKPMVRTLQSEGVDFDKMIKQEEGTLIAAGREFSFKIMVKNIHVSKKANPLRIISFNADILVKKVASIQ